MDGFYLDHQRPGKQSGKISVVVVLIFALAIDSGRKPQGLKHTKQEVYQNRPKFTYPNVEFDVFICDRFDVEADSWDRVYMLAQL